MKLWLKVGLVQGIGLVAVLLLVTTAIRYTGAPDPSITKIIPTGSATPPLGTIIAFFIIGFIIGAFIGAFFDKLKATLASKIIMKKQVGKKPNDGGKKDARKRTSKSVQ